MKVIFRIKLSNLFMFALLVAVIAFGLMGSGAFMAQADGQACANSLQDGNLLACSEETADCNNNCSPPQPGTDCSDHCVDVGWIPTLPLTLF